MLAAEFIALSESGKPEVQVKLFETGKKLGAALLPAAAKFAVNTVGHWAIGNAKLSDDLTAATEALGDTAADGLENLVASQLAAYQASKSSLEAFKKSLSELSSGSDRPIVIFLDELDRCRPDFAIRTIERVKHFFDAPGVVFVLLLNQRQLAAAVEGLYGAKVDAAAYLSKFIPISLTLPKILSVKHDDDDNRKHAKAELLRLGFKDSDANRGFANMLGLFAAFFGFSLRDVERAVVLYSFAQPINNSSFESAWPIAVKLKFPELYKRLCVHEPAAHKEAQELAASLKKLVPDEDWLLVFFEALHKSGATGFTGPPHEDAMRHLRTLGSWHSPRRYMTWIFGRIDLSVAE